MPAVPQGTVPNGDVPDAERPFQWRHWTTLGVIVALVTGVIFFGVNVGMGALAGAVLLVLVGATDEAQALRAMPWGPILMVSGVTVLIALIEKTGGIDLFSAMLASVSTPQSVTAVIAFLGGTISVYSSTSGVVLPAFLPTVPGLVERLGGRGRAAGRLVADRRLLISSMCPRCRPPAPCALPPRTTPTSASCSGRCWPGVCRWRLWPPSAATSCLGCCGGKASRSPAARSLSPASRLFRPRIQSPAAYLSYEQATPVFAALNESPPPAAGWGRWIATADAATRARVTHGDETSIVNLLLFGTSFTTQPRITSRQLDAKQIGAAVEERIRDFERALALPGTQRASAVRAADAGRRGTGESASSLDGRSVNE